MTPFEKKLKEEFDKLEKDYDGLDVVMKRMACEHAVNEGESFSDDWYEDNELNSKIDNMLMNGGVN